MANLVSSERCVFMRVSSKSPRMPQNATDNSSAVRICSTIRLRHL